MRSKEVSSDLLIREPREAESRLCRMLLPGACSQPIGRHYRLAFKGTPEKLVGALSYRDDATALGGLAVHVIPTSRRMRIGSELLEYAAERARSWGRNRIISDVDLHSDPAAEAFLQSCGFQKAGTITSAEISMDDWLVHMQRYRDRVRAGVVKLPASCRFAGLSEVAADEVTRLHAEHVAHTQALPGMRQSLRLDRATDSLAMLLDERLAGFVLARIEHDVLQILSWVVASPFRGQDLGRALLYELAARARDKVGLMRFEFTRHAVITARMMDVPGCRVTEIKARFTRSAA